MTFWAYDEICHLLSAYDTSQLVLIFLTLSIMHGFSPRIIPHNYDLDVERVSTLNWTAQYPDNGEANCIHYTWNTVESQIAQWFICDELTCTASFTKQFVFINKLEFSVPRRYENKIMRKRTWNTAVSRVTLWLCCDFTRWMLPVDSASVFIDKS